MTPFPRTAAAALCLLLAACGNSTPLRYHALAPTPGQATPGGAAILVEVLPIAVPERVNREEMVLTGPGGQLDVRVGDRWASPPADEMRQMIDDALWRRARAADTYMAPLPAAQSGGLPLYRLALRLERLDAVAGRQASVEASWTLRKLSDPKQPPAVCRTGAVRPLASATSEDAAAALSQAAAQVAEAVAGSLDKLNRGEPDPCRI